MTRDNRDEEGALDAHGAGRKPNGGHEVESSMERAAQVRAILPANFTAQECVTQ